MQLRILLVLAAVSMSLAAPGAVGQGAPSLTITIVDLAPSGTVNAGGTHSASFSVNVQASGFQCTQAGEIVLDLAITNAGSAPTGVAAAVDPPNASIPIPAGIYGLPAPAPLPVGAPLNASASATLRVTTTAASFGNFPVSVSASYAGGPAGMGCVGDLPAQSQTATHALSITGGGGGNGTAPPPPGTPPGTPPGGNNTTSPPPPPPSGNPLPGFEPLVLAGAGVIALLVRRRRD